MELILCFLIAFVVTGGRSLGDIIHAAKGTTPPRIERAKLKAAARPAGSKEPSAFQDYWATVWRDAWTDAKAHHERTRAEKQAGARPTVGLRARRVWRLLVDPVGGPRPEGPDVIDPPAGVVEGWAAGVRRQYPEPPSSREEPPDPWRHAEPVAEPIDPTEPEPAPRRDADGRLLFGDDATDPTGTRACPDCKGEAVKDGQPCSSCVARQQQRNEDNDRSRAGAADHPNSNGGTPMTAATGEVQTYEQHKAEIAAQRQEWQTQLDLAAASAEAARAAKAALNAQAEHGRAVAAAARAKADGVAGAGLDGETQAHAGLQADAIDPNALDAQFEALDGIEADAVAAAQRAEAALAALDAEEATIDAKYGDAANTVASDLGGNASYLESGGGNGAPQVPAGANRGWSEYLDGPRERQAPRDLGDHAVI